MVGDKLTMKNVILVLPLYELPAKGGPQISVRNLIKAVSKNCYVHVYIMATRNMIGGEEAINYLKKYCSSISWSPSSIIKSYFNISSKPKLYGVIRIIDAVRLIVLAIKHKTKIIWFDRAEELIPEFIYMVKGIWPHCIPICDTCSIYSEFILRELQFAEDFRKESIIQSAQKKSHQEIILTNMCNVVTAVSDRDAQYYRKIALLPEKVHLVSNVVDIDQYSKETTPPVNFDGNVIVCTGTFYDKNCPMVDGANWFINNVWHGLYKANPNTKLFFIGKGADKYIKELSLIDGVFVVGTVEDIVPYLQHATIGIVPLQWESGTRFKILEYGACSLPVVSTRLGAEGIELIDGKDIFITDDPIKFCEYISLLLKDRSLRVKIGNNLKRVVTEKYSLRTMIQEVSNVLEYVSVEKG